MSASRISCLPERLARQRPMPASGVQARLSALIAEQAGFEALSLSREAVA